MGQRTDDHLLFPARLREARRAKSLTQKALAQAAGTNYVNVSRMESGKHVPSIELASRLAAALGCRVSDLLAPAKKGRKP